MQRTLSASLKHGVLLVSPSDFFVCADVVSGQLWRCLRNYYENLKKEKMSCKH